MANSTMTQVIGVASGKSGVGKTTISVNLAVALQGMGHRVMLFDADLGLANAQIALGCRCPFNLSHFLAGEKTLQEIIVTTRQGVKLVPGASGMQEMAALSDTDANRIVQAFSSLEDQIDFLIVDMAAGIAPAVMSFMSACARRFVVVRDDPSSIADAYGTIKVLIQDHGLDEIYLIPNGVASAQEGYQLFERINQVCARFLNHTVRYLGSIENDEMILTALKKYQSVIEFAPGSAGARDFRRLAEAVRQLPTTDNLSGGLQFFLERLVKARS
jgi:flagellar biosynthesis protein FlhG